MPLEPIACNQCGARLHIPPDAKFVTCTHCGSQLAVRKNESVRYTEAIEQIDQRTQQLTAQVAHLSYESALARLDREWEQERETYLTTHKDGHRTEPSAGASLFGGAFAALMGLVFVFTAPGPMPLFGLLFVAFGIFIAFHGYNAAQRFEAARSRYQFNRANLDPAQFLPGDSGPASSGEQSPEDFLARHTSPQSQDLFPRS